MDDQNQGNDDNQDAQHYADQAAVGGFGTPPPEDNSDPSTDEHSYPTVDNHAASHPTSSDESSDKLLDIKVKAISELTPLVKHLDQSPEERFKTTLMMIQVSDNQDLIQDAYDAAQQIPDEKAKAHALLDIVNEINYFTKQSS